MRIIYFDLDCTRLDHLGVYGYHRDTSPVIDLEYIGRDDQVRDLKQRLRVTRRCAGLSQVPESRY